MQSSSVYRDSSKTTVPSRTGWWQRHGIHWPRRGLHNFHHSTHLSNLFALQRSTRSAQFSAPSILYTTLSSTSLNLTSSKCAEQLLTLFTTPNSHPLLRLPKVENSPVDQHGCRPLEHQALAFDVAHIGKGPARKQRQVMTGGVRRLALVLCGEVTRGG